MIYVQILSTVSAACKVYKHECLIKVFQHVHTQILASYKKFLLQALSNVMNIPNTNVEMPSVFGIGGMGIQIKKN